MSEKISGFVKPGNINQTTIRLAYLDKFKSLIQPGDIYEFGVYSGVSIRNILSKYREFQLPTKVWGFDSFCGLPLETKEPIAYDVWNQGEFSSCDYLDVDSPEKAAKVLESQINAEYPEYHTEMIIGFYSDSLKTCPIDKMLPASWLDIDVDLYSSTINVLEFMFSNKLVVPGTIVYYDDWKDITFGEGRAHVEMCEKYNVKMEHIDGTGERLFIVTGV